MPHTPGPWIADDFEVRNESGELVAEVNYILDAHLIAASPELLEALKWALESVNCEPHEWTLEEDADMHFAALAAIAKAEVSSAAQE